MHLVHNYSALTTKGTNVTDHTVTWLLKHCPLRGNGSINKRAVARQ
jgi:hypothetical protein